MAASAAAAAFGADPMREVSVSWQVPAPVNHPFPASLTVRGLDESGTELDQFTLIR